MSRDRSGALAIFVKTPGFSPVKTRLALSIGTSDAEQFYVLSAKTVAAAVGEASRCVRLTPYWAVAEQGALGDPLWSRFQRIWQGDGELGERLGYVYEELIRRYSFVVFIGADSPDLSAKRLVDASSLLSQDTQPNFVIGRAEDGGFYLFGGSAPIPRRIWREVPYSQSTTATELAFRIERLGTLKALPPLLDVDTFEDLKSMVLAEDQNQEVSSERKALRSWVRQLLLQVDSSRCS